jgi:hypothetical protein
MTQRFLPGLVAILILAGAGVAYAQGQGQVYVLESTVDTVKIGTIYALGDRITIPAGGSVRAVMPSGKTQTIKGPFSGPFADLAKGQKANGDVMTWLKNLFQTGGSSERTPGATRSFRPPEPSAPFSWTAIPSTADSTICVQQGAKLQLRRTSSSRAERFIVLDQETAQRGETEFAAGSNTASWPPGVALRPNAAYALLGPDNRPRRQVTLRVLDSLPDDDDVLAELATRGCKHQFDAWVNEKILASKRRAS